MVGAITARTINPEEYLNMDNKVEQARQKADISTRKVLQNTEEKRNNAEARFVTLLENYPTDVIEAQLQKTQLRYNESKEQINKSNGDKKAKIEEMWRLQAQMNMIQHELDNRNNFGNIQVELGKSEPSGVIVKQEANIGNVNI